MSTRNRIGAIVFLAGAVGIVGFCIDTILFGFARCPSHPLDVAFPLSVTAIWVATLIIEKDSRP